MAVPASSPTLRRRRLLRTALSLALAALAFGAATPAAQASCITPQGTFSIQVAGCPAFASFTASASQVLPGDTVSFDASASQPSDPTYPITGYEWDFENTGYASGPVQTSHTFATRGVYTVKLRVTTSDGTDSATAEVSRQIIVSTPPVARIAVSPQSASTTEPVTLSSAGSSDPDGQAVTYMWDLGSGSFDTPSGNAGADESLTHVFPNPGTFTIRVRVRDADGATSVAAATLTVAEPPAPPAPPAGGAPGSDPGGTGAPAGPGSDPAGPGAIDDPVGAETSFAAVLSGLAIQRYRVVSRRGLALYCRANRAATCIVRAQISARDARRLKLRTRGRRPLVIGQARVRLAGARSARVVLRLSAKTRRALRRKGTMARLRTIKILVTGTAADSASHRVSLGRAVLLRR